MFDVKNMTKGWPVELISRCVGVIFFRKWLCSSWL
jgi:hypothetical protein